MLDLIFTSTGNTSIKLRRIGHPRYTQISANNENYTVGESIPLSNNQQVEFKIHPTVFYFSESPNDYFNFVIEGEGTVTVSGNINRTPTDYCYYSLFSGCNKLTDASQLQIHQGGDYPNKDAKMFCFSNMFKDCTALTTPPSSLAASGLAEWCYQGMFAGCTALTATPILPATTLAPYCYYAMFYGCSSLTSAPYLSASTLVDWCYNSMFYNCQSLTSISADFTDWNTSGNSTKNWVTGIETNGKMYNKDVIEIHGDDNIPNNWIITIDPTVPLTFKSIGNTTVRLTDRPAGSMYYSKNGGEWTSLQLESDIVLNDNDKVSISGTTYDSFYSTVKTGGNGSLFVYGNPQSLFDFDTDLSNHLLSRLFSDCTNIIDSSRLVLSSLSLGAYCYRAMFSGCTSLTSAPSVLPATTLAEGCYLEMFSGCTSLLKSPVILATKLSSWSYAYMFANCTSLTSININFTDWGENQPTQTLILPDATFHWLKDVTNSNGVFIKPKALTEKRNIIGGQGGLQDSYIPTNWTVINK